jgi:hypothetical protein
MLVIRVTSFGQRAPRQIPKHSTGRHAEQRHSDRVAEPAPTRAHLRKFLRVGGSGGGVCHATLPPNRIGQSPWIPLPRVQVVSDIHAEFGPHAIPNQADVAAGAGVVIQAGDTAAAPDAVGLAAKLFPDSAAIVLISGNHENYETSISIDDGLDSIHRAASLSSATRAAELSSYRTPRKTLDAPMLPFAPRR